MIEAYSHYKFEVLFKESYATNNVWKGWVYEIHLDCHYQPNIESDEWYDTEQEARFAAIGHISKLEDGPDEPDYEAPTAHETYLKAHEDRRKLRGY